MEGDDPSSPAHNLDSHDTKTVRRWYSVSRQSLLDVLPLISLMGIRTWATRTFPSSFPDSSSPEHMALSSSRALFEHAWELEGAVSTSETTWSFRMGRRSSR